MVHGYDSGANGIGRLKQSLNVEKVMWELIDYQK